LFSAWRLGVLWLFYGFLEFYNFFDTTSFVYGMRILLLEMCLLFFPLRLCTHWLMGRSWAAHGLLMHSLARGLLIRSSHYSLLRRSPFSF
jgi:hypothetical protein